MMKSIAREIADKVRNNATIDWTMKESARAKLMVIVKQCSAAVVVRHCAAILSRMSL